jgi:transcriptional regulator with XRE-family HTH domain
MSRNVKTVITIEEKIQNVLTNIRTLRRYRDYNQEYMASKIGFSQNAYSKIEMSNVQLTLDRLFEISELLEVDAVDLLILSPTELIKAVVGSDE